MGKPVRVAFVGDTSDLRGALQQSEKAMEDAARTARDSGQKVESAFSSTANAADATASASAQAAGGIGDLAGGLAATGLISEGTAQSLDVASQAIMGATGAADLLNLATEKIPGLQKAATFATNVLAKAKRGLGMAIRFAMGPVGLILIGITALIALFVLLYKRNETFRRVVDKVWAAVKAAISNVVSWIRENVPPVWEKIKNGARVAFGVISRVIKAIPLVWLFNNFDKIVTTVKGLPRRITTAAGGMWDGIKNAFRSAINYVISKWNSLSFSIPSVNIPGLGKIGGGTLSTPDIPMLADGGIVNRATLAVIGERGPEAVIPLDGRHSLGNNTLNVTVHVPPTADPVSTGRHVAGALSSYIKAGGRINLSPSFVG